MRERADRPLIRAAEWIVQLVEDLDRADALVKLRRIWPRLLLVWVPAVIFAVSGLVAVIVVAVMVVQALQGV